jgi:glycosyl hydrolase family 26
MPLHDHTEAGAPDPRRTRRRILAALAVTAGIVVVGGAITVPLLVRAPEPERPSRTETRPHPRPAPRPRPARPHRPARPAPPPERLVTPSSGLYLGVYSPGLMEKPGGLRAWTRAHGAQPRIVNWFQQWLSGERRFRADWARRVAAQGAVPMITWEPWWAPEGTRHTVDQPKVRLRLIADGRYDRYIRSWARAIVRYRGPVLIRLMHEMNGTWYPWAVGVNGNSPALYVRAWRHIHDVFEREGATNVQWVWSVNNLEQGGGAAHDIERYYPGARYVDWVATSGFNWGDAYSWSGWREPDLIYGDTYRALARFRKPIMLSEVGATATGGDPAAWVRETLATVRRHYPRLRALVWYDAIDDGGLDFRLEGPTQRSLAPAAGWFRPLRIAPAPRRAARA